MTFLKGKVTTTFADPSTPMGNGFNRFWRQFLAEERLPFLHMTDLVARCPPYQSFKQSDEGRILRRARFIMSNCGLLGVASGVNRKDFREVVKTDSVAFRKIGSPYALCATTAIHQVAELVRKRFGDVLVTYAFGDLGSRIEGIKVRGELINSIDQYRLSPTLSKQFYVSQPAQFLEMKAAYALQAADVQAYEATTHMNNRLGFRHKNRDLSAARSLATVAHDNKGYWDREKSSGAS